MAAAFDTEMKVVNEALRLLGAAPLVSSDDTVANITTTGVVANLVKENYAFWRDVVLMERKWGFATFIEMLDTPDNTPPVLQYDERFALADLTVFPLLIYRVLSSRDITVEAWQISGDFIEVRGASTIYVEFTGQVTDPAVMPVQFITALIYKLAQVWSPTVTKSTAKESEMMNLYQHAMRSGAGNDGLQGTRRNVTKSSLVNARHIGANSIGSTV